MIHIAAATQIRLDTEGRAYYRRKLAAGKTRMEAMRCLKRRISDAIYRQLVADAQRLTGTGPGEHCGATQTIQRGRPAPHIDTSDQPLLGLAPKTLLAITTHAHPAPARLPSQRADAPEPSTWSAPLDERPNGQMSRPSLRRHGQSSPSSRSRGLLAGSHAFPAPTPPSTR
jgi:hypothetical protein